MKLFRLKWPHMTFLPQEIHNWQVVVYGLVVSLCFFIFQHVDLYHTILSANAYLSGHFVDFYDYNKPIVGGNDYYPLIYIAFALWNFPLKLVDWLLAKLIPGSSFVLVANQYPLSAIQIFWSKLLLVLIFFATAVVIYRIVQLISKGDKDQAKMTAAVFVSAPIAVFIVFIFGQYDIVAISLTMLGYYYYLQRNLTKFCCLLALAVTFKFFALVLVIPLLLLVEKRIIHLLKYGCIVLSATVMLALIYWNNLAFRQHTLFTLAGSKLTKLPELFISTFNHSSYLMLFYLIICLYAYIREPGDDAQLQKQSIFIALAAYSAIFSTILWHPQWLLWTTPFFALSTLYMTSKGKFYLIELIAMIAYVYLVVNFFPSNVDVTMLTWGPLGHLFPNPVCTNRELIFYHPVMMLVFNLYLVSPLLILVFQQTEIVTEQDPTSAFCYFNARFLFGIGFFVITSLLCIWSPRYLPQSITSRIYHILPISSLPENIASRLFSRCYMETPKLPS